MRRLRAVSLATAALLVLLAPAGADESQNRKPQDVPLDDAEIDGREIYRRVLANRFQAVTQESRLISGDSGGRTQETKFELHWKDLQNGGEPPQDGVVGKLVVQYLEPFDLRNASYLILLNRERVNDQFVYLPSRRTVKRVNLRSEALFGTDFSFEDVIPREIEKATYERLDDEEWEGRPVFAIALTPRELANSEYSRFLVYVDQERYVPLRTLYWDSAGVLVKELYANPDRVRLFREVWVPMEMTMKHLVLETFTTLVVTYIQPDPDLPDTIFELRRLEQN